MFLFVGFVGFVIYYFNFVVTGPRGETPFALAHERAVRTFVEGKGFGIRRFREEEYFHERSVVIDDEIWEVDKLHLIGTSEEYGERYFYGGRVPLKRKLGEAKHRLLMPEEAEAIAKLRKEGRDYVILESAEAALGSRRKWLRVVAPVLAEESCLKCHEAKVGNLLGAFDYLLYREGTKVRGD